MKKLTILALHLGYGGIEKCIADLSNSLCNDYDINIICTYKLYDKPPFKLDNKINVEYLINDDLAIRVDSYKKNLRHLQFIKLFKELSKDYLKKGKLNELIRDTFCSIKVVQQKKSLMIDAIKKCDSDIIISTRDIHNLWLSKYGKENTLKIGWEHNHHHGDEKYVNKIVNSVYGLDYFVLVSKNLTNFYSEKLKNANVKCVYIPNGIDFFPQEKAELNSNNIVSVGRLSKEKGYLDLIDVFKIVHENNPKARLDIIGDGSEKEVIENKIKNNQLDKYVKLHGYQKKDYINDILKDASVYAMCSYTESFGIVLLEAFAFGIPCVAFDSAEGANEIISDNWDGYLVKNRDKERMAKRICDLLSNQNRRIVMGANGLKKAKKYDNSKIKDEWLELLDRKK